MGKKKMNKLVVAEKNIVIDNEKIELELKGDIQITCCGKNTVVIHNKDNVNLHIVLNDESSLKLLMVNFNKKGSSNITIEQNNNTSIVYKESFISKEDTDLTINNIVKGKNSKSNIKIRCISKKNNIKINVLAKVLENTQDNDIIEDIKGINDGGTVLIEPNMEIDTSLVSANHFVTIGEIDKDSLFYLQTQGIKKSIAQELILKGFLKSIFREEKIDMFGGE